MNICAIALFYIMSLLSFEGALIQEGSASYYGTRFQGRKTASGERYNMCELTAAHATLPFNTMVEVTNLKNNKTVVVRINDRMSARNTKVIDMSKAAAIQLDMVRDGIGKVMIKELSAAEPEFPAITADSVIAVGNIKP